MNPLYIKNAIGTLIQSNNQFVGLDIKVTNNDPDGTKRLDCDAHANLAAGLVDVARALQDICDTLIQMQQTLNAINSRFVHSDQQHNQQSPMHNNLHSTTPHILNRR